MELIINGRFLTQRMTGVQRFAWEALCALDALVDTGALSPSLRIRVATPRRAKPHSDLRRIPFEPIGALGGHAWEQLELARFARGNTLVSLCNTGPVTSMNQIVVIHDAAVWAAPQGYSRAFRLWYRMALPRLARRAARVLTVSEFSRHELSHWLGIRPDRIGLLPESGEHILRVTADAGIVHRHKLERERYVLAVSSLNPNKNFAAVLKAFRLIKKRCKGIRLVIAGSADERVFASHDLPSDDPDVTRVGYVTDSELRALYENAACLVYPSLYEGFGLPPLEAMTCGCPVVASNQASLPETCGQAALFCDPMNVTELADKLEMVVNDSGKRNEMRFAGMSHASRTTWADTARAIVRVAAGMRDYGLASAGEERAPC